MMGSDHTPIGFTVLPSNAPRRPPPKSPNLRWDYQKRPNYVHDLYLGSGAQRVVRSAGAAERGGDVETTLRELEGAVRRAASTAGMGPRVPRGEGAPRETKLPLTREELGYKREIVRLCKAGHPVPPDLRKNWRTAVRRARKQAAEARHPRMREWLKQNPRMFWQKYKQQLTDDSEPHALFTTAEWQEHFESYFRVNPNRVHVPSGNMTMLSEGCLLTGAISAAEVLRAFKKVGTCKAT